MSTECARGWHRLALRIGFVHFRYLGRLTDAHGTFLYRFGPEPDDAACRTIWCYDDRGRPWKCAACGRKIDGPATVPPGVVH